jgi:hypothetical protein
MHDGMAAMSPESGGFPAAPRKSNFDRPEAFLRHLLTFPARALCEVGYRPQIGSRAPPILP